jgi:hypothetical protein
VDFILTYEKFTIFFAKGTGINSLCMATIDKFLNFSKLGNK